MRLLAGLCALILGLGAIGYFARPGAARSSAALFETRCSTCHARPDLQGYSARERRAIVMTMLGERGADKVITPEEARRIIAFIAPARRVVSQKDQEDGDT